MLADRFPAGRLAFANGVFYAGIPLGFAASFVLAGSIGPRLGWRACFFTLGLCGLLAVAAVSRLAEPPRGGPRGDAPPRFRELPAKLGHALADRPALLLVSLAGACLAFASASSQHGITWLVQERSLPYARAAFLSALVLAPAGLIGNLGIGALADRLRRRGAGGRLPILAAAGAAGFGCAAAFYTLPVSSPLFGPCWFLAQAWMLGWFGALLASLDELAPAGLRATVLGFGLLTVNLLGVAVGPWVTGLIGDRASLTSGLLVSLVVGSIGLLLLVAARRCASPAADDAS
jgi:predicted MFS family arabinose efflux permease